LRELLFRTTTRSTTIIVGINRLTRLLTTDLEAAGHDVPVIDLVDEALEDSDGGDELMLAGPGVRGASCVMAATANDERNLNLCGLAHRTFRVPMVIAGVGLLGGVTSWARLRDSGVVKMTWNDMVPAILGGL